MIKIIVCGVKGRMGSRIAALVEETPDMKLVAGIDIGDNLDTVINNADVLIDFTVAKAAVEHTQIATRHKKAMVIGTTGFTDEQNKIISDAAHLIPIVKSPNMSIGVNVLFELTKFASEKLGNNYRIDIEETHHIHKLDRPSGTAKKILNIVLAGVKRDKAKDVAIYEEEKPDTNLSPISVISFRKGEVVGDHSITFSGKGETLTFTHHAISRDVFANGAIVAARWIAVKPPRLYSMDDVLNLE